MNETYYIAYRKPGESKWRYAGGSLLIHRIRFLAENIEEALEQTRASQPTFEIKALREGEVLNKREPLHPVLAKIKAEPQWELPTGDPEYRRFVEFTHRLGRIRTGFFSVSQQTGHVCGLGQHSDTITESYLRKLAEWLDKLTPYRAHEPAAA